jgi:Zn-dependent protease with chaperone function
MNYEKYVSLIQKLEVYAAEKPKAYQNKVALLAMLGYGYFIGLILLFVSVPVVLIGLFIINPDVFLRAALQLLKLWWLILPLLVAFFGFLGGAVKSLTVKVPEPEGLALERAQAPDLFDFVEKTCVQLKAEKPEKILVSDEFNAAVVTLPRFGLFGRKVYLILGLPLMCSLSAQQFEAVVTHEIGHISSRHGSFAKWAYQLHETWRRFLESQELQENRLAFLYKKFVDWFFPYFSAYSFVLMRGHEREADVYAVQATGARALGEALISLETKSAAVNDFWNEIYEENARSETPPTGVFTQMVSALRRGDGAREADVLNKVLAIRTDYADSHPSLNERLRLIGYWNGEATPALPAPVVGKNAAEIFFGDALEKYKRLFDADWDEKIRQNWKARHQEIQNSQSRLAELENKSENENLSVEELFEKAGLISEIKGNAEALPVLRQIVNRFPENAEANYALGGVLLEADDESGLRHLEKAVNLDEKLKLPAHEIAFQYLRRKGRHDEAKIHAESIERQYEIIQHAQNERNNVSPNDVFEPHQLSAETVETIRKKLTYFDEIEAMYIAQKKVQYFSDMPLNVLFLDLKKKGWLKNGDSLNSQDLLNIAAERTSALGIHFFAVLEKDFAAVKQQLEQIENAKIFQR